MVNVESMEMKLQDCCEAIVDCPHTTAPDEGEGYPLVRTPNIGKGRLIYNGMHRVSESVYKQRNKRMTPLPGDLIFAREAPAGNVAILQPGEFVCLGQRTVLLRVDKKVADSSYLAYYLLSPIVRHTLIELANGATVSHINIPDLKKLEISLPPLPTQRRIAAVLGALDDKIELNRKMNANLEAQAQALFKSWFVDFEPWGGRMPAGWKNWKLGDVCKCVLGGTPSRSKKEYWGGNISWINSGMVNEFRIVEASENITEVGLKHSATKMLPRKTTVLAITGATLGQYSLLEIDSAANQSVIGIVENTTLPYEFIYPFIANSISGLLSHATGGAQQHINKQDVESLDVAVPTVEIIAKYKEITAPIYDRIAEACFESRKLAELRDALLPKLMSGRLRVDATACQGELSVSAAEPLRRDKEVA